MIFVKSNIVDKLAEFGPTDGTSAGFVKQILAALVKRLITMIDYARCALSGFADYNE